MRYRLRTLLIVLALGPMVLAIFIGLGQLHWHRAEIRRGGGVPSENDAAVQEEIDRAMRYKPLDPRDDWESPHFVPPGKR